ncbi:MAG: asparagine synthase (glutamine-hydrolysing) [Planctomycetota bacterium]|nr:MAG: asparagine synthase (glutamine-hydrolysing) [Planctomycetota bacterium]
MCGIAGAAWTADAVPLSPATLERMISAVKHRGPDDSGTHFSSAAALGFRRLSIVFNGEIYNYRELRTDLEARGHRFRTNTDTECIVHLYEELGPECVDRLRGMFAFAIWDDRNKRLMLARDRAGKKPLSYRLDRGQLTFASELKSLLLVPGAPRRLNKRAIDSYLCYQYVPHPDCILEGYHKLPPAHVAVFEDGDLSVRRYWRPPFDQTSEVLKTSEVSAAESAPWSPAQWQHELRRTLTEAVRLRMRSDVPIGAFLSGGIDSTIITGLMQEQSDRPVHSFSMGFPIKEFDERSYAREAAKHLGTEHHEMVVEPNAIDILPKLIWHYDEPFADSSAIPTMLLSQMTRQHVTVALSGDGGDELFAGYTRYLAVKLASRFDRLPSPIKQLITAKLWQRLPSGAGHRSLLRRGKRFLAALGERPEKRYLRWVGIFEESQRHELYRPEFAAELGDFDAGDFLLQVDHEVMELAAKMPIELKLRGNQGKQILLDTFSDLLPPSIQRRGKMGFGVPLPNWFRGELQPFLRDVLFDSRTLARSFFEPSAVQRLFDEHVQGKTDHAHRLWALLCLELWQRMFLDSAEPPASCPSSL